MPGSENRQVRFVRLSWRKILLSVLVGVFATGLMGCFPLKKLTIANVGMILQDVAGASSKHTEVALIRSGTPAYLMLLDGLIEAHPKQKKLLLAGAEAYSLYATAFVAEEDPETARGLYLRGKGYALRAMPRHKAFASVLREPYDALEVYVQDFSKNDVPALFSFASCWAGWISTSMDSVKAMADLPKVVLLMDRVIQLDETHYYGGAHLFMGVYKSARPKGYGGEPEEARRHFDRAVEIGEGNFLMAYVYYADHYARKTLQRDLFVSLLETALETPTDRVPELTLINTVAKSRAKELLSHVEEYF